MFIGPFFPLARRASTYPWDYTHYVFIFICGHGMPIAAYTDGVLGVLFLFFIFRYACSSKTTWPLAFRLPRLVISVLYLARDLAFIPHLD